MRFEAELDRFTAMYCFFTGVNFNHIRGFALSEMKRHCAFLAYRIVKAPISELSDYYRVPELYLKRCILDFEIDIQTEDELIAYYEFYHTPFAVLAKNLKKPIIKYNFSKN